jgi:hypothetical protein
MTSDPQYPLRKHLLELLEGGDAHVHFETAVEGLDPALRGVKAGSMPHTAWQLVEHMHLALWDILEFSRDPKHVSPPFPEGYWPKTDAPPTAAAWKKTIAAFKADLKAMIDLVMNPQTDLFAAIPHGDGQTILREALLVADHNAYHLGQLLAVRRFLGAWSDS